MITSLRYLLEKVVNEIRANCFFIIEWIFLYVSKRTVKQVSNKILIVRLDAIGDFILWFDAAQGLRSLYPKNRYQITLLGNNIWTNLAADFDLFDDIWSLDRRKFSKNIFYRLAMLTKIRREGFGIAIQPTYSREFMYGDSIINASCANERIGSEGDCSNIEPWQKRISDRWYTRLIPAANDPLMVLIRNAEFMRGLGLTEFKAGIPALPVSAKMPQGMNIENYYVLFPGAGVRIRQWPIENFKKVAERIYRATGWVGIVCGGPGEEALGTVLEDHADVPLQNWVEKTSLQELISIIAGAHFLVANETSAVHIAAAVSTPSVCILGGGHFDRFMPYRLEQETDKPLPVAVVHKLDCFGCNWECLYNQSLDKVAPCVSHISVDDVWEAVEKILVDKDIV